MKKLLVISSAFPRWKNDVYANFVNDLVNSIKNFNITVLAPHDYRIKKEEIINKINIKRFYYFYPLRFQKLAYAVIPNLKKNPLLILLLPFFLIAFLFSTIRLIKKERFDVMNSQWILPTGLIGALCNKLFGIKHIVTSHGGDIETLNKLPFKRGIANFILRNSNGILFVSSYSKSIFEGLIKKEFKSSLEKKSLILPMGVNVNKLRTKTGIGKIKKPHNIKSEKILIFIGRLEERKGLTYLINAIPTVLSTKFDVRLFILGDGPIKNKLQNQVKKLNLNSNVRFLGHTFGKKKLDLLKAADILIMPSLSEGLPVALLEGLATGKAIIATKVGGIEDIIKDNSTGILIKPKNENEISNAILKLLRNPKLIRKLSKNSYNLGKNYDWKNIAEKYEMIFNK